MITGAATLTFNCADNTGKFRVVAEELNAGGQVLAQSHSFSIFQRSLATYRQVIKFVILDY